MKIIVINDGWDGKDMDNLRILVLPENSFMEADVSVLVRDWLAHIYEGAESDEDRHWRNRRALASRVVEQAIRSEKLFWRSFSIERASSFSVEELLVDIPGFTYQVSERDVLAKQTSPDE